MKCILALIFIITHVINCSEFKNGDQQFNFDHTQHITWSQQMSQHISGMNDATFYATALTPNFSPLVDSAIEKNIIGIHIEGPSIADINNFSDIPVWGIRQESFFKSYHYRLDRLGILVVSHLQSDAIFIGEAFTRKGADEPIPQKPETDFRKGYSIDNFVIFPKKQIPSLEWYTGDYLIRLIVFDAISNPMVCTIPEQAFPKLSQAFGTPLNHIENCSFNQTANSPDLPVKKGITISIVKEQKKAILFGSYLLPKYNTSNASEPQPIIPIGIILTGSDQAEPIILTIDIGKNYIEKPTGELAGFFSFVLSEIPEFRMHSRKTALYAFYKDVVSAPSVIDISSFK